MDLTSTVHSFTTHPNLALSNPGLQTHKVNSMQQPLHKVNSKQQPLHIPWDNSARNSNPPFMVLPGLNQFPLSTVLPSQNPLILVPLPSVSSPTLQPSLCTSVLPLPLSNPTIDNEPTLDLKETRTLNNCTIPLAMKPCPSPLPILSQPTLLHSQCQGSSSSCKVTALDNTVYLKSLSSSPGKALVSKQNSCDGIVKGRDQIANKIPKCSSHSLPGIPGNGEMDKPATTFSSNSDLKKINFSAVKPSHCSEQQFDWMYGESEEAVQINNDNISKIISSLPPGWKVVGLTSLENASANVPCTAENRQMPSNTIPIIQTQVSNINSTSSPPDVVSVDLNVSSAMTYLSSSSRNDVNLNKCSLQLHTTPSSHMISVKTELNESGRLASVQDETATDSTHRNGQKGEGWETLKIPSPYPIFIKTEPEPLVSTDNDGKGTFLESQGNQWTVVGITSLPYTSVTNTDPVTQNAISSLPSLISSSAATISPHDSSHQNEITVKPVSPKMTILNVPSPKTSHPVKNSSIHDAIIPSQIQSSKPADHDAIYNDTDAPKQNLLSKNSEWTIVGVTFASNSTKSHHVYSDVATQYTSLGNDYLQNLSKFITLDAIKSQLMGEDSKTPSDTSFSEMIKALSTIVNKQEKNPSLNVSQPQMNDQWKVVGITQIPDDQNIPKMPENCFISQDVATVKSSVNTCATITTSTSKGRINCPTLISASSSSLSSPASSSPSSSSSLCISSNTVSDQYHNNTLNRCGASSVLNIPKSDFHANEPVQFLNSLFQQDSGHQSTDNVNLLNNFQKFVGILSVDPLSQLNHTDMAKPTLFNSSSDVSACPQQAKRNDVDVNSTSSPGKLENNKPKFQCIEKCIGKSDCVSRKAKDMCVRCMKKHTVSHLLKMKRMKAKEQGCCVEDNVKEDNFECVGQNFKIARRLSDKIMKRLTKVEREGRSRPLHSYAGNRKMFSKPLPVNKSVSLEKINLRSGTQVPVWNYESDCMEKNETLNEVSIKNEDEDIEINSHIELKNEIRSAARKRKLKVPRKMIADMDYHPFDSSSDSN